MSSAIVKTSPFLPRVAYMVAGVIVLFLIAYGFDVVTEPEPLAPMENNQSGGIPVTDHHNQSQAQPAK